jgi:hypothetical protein
MIVQIADKWRIFNMDKSDNAVKPGTYECEHRHVRGTDAQKPAQAPPPKLVPPGRGMFQALHCISRVGSRKWRAHRVRGSREL